MKTPLPIDPLLPRIAESLREHPNLVLIAAPGAGKTTRVPPYLIASGLLDGKNRECLMLQPRRIATRAVSARIADENGWRLGEEVGYQVRFENRSGPRTRLRVVTEGILTRRLQSDPALDGVGLVILDEFHERSLHTDLSLALLRELQQGLREDLRILVMSATLDAAPVARFLSDCPILESPGRAFSVDLRHRARAGVWSELRGLERDVVDAVKSLVSDSTDDGGHVLVFLPGAAEIRRAQTALAPLAANSDFAVLPLHGSLSSDEQDRVLKPSATRKVILATNIAETSLTIDGVSAVVDAGLSKVLRCDPKFGLERLELTRISAASATQRTGRAGRQREGRAIRLWSKTEDAQLRDHESPEVKRVDLTQACLTLADWGVRDPLAFPWFEAPAWAQIESARGLLKMLGALDSEGGITPLGRAILGIPLHPRLGRFVVAAALTRDTDLMNEAAICAALLSERDILLRHEAGAHVARGAESDLQLRLEAFGHAERARFDRALRDEGIDGFAARSVAGVRDQLLRQMERVAIPGAASDDTQISDFLLRAFPDRITRRRGAGDARGLMVGGRGVVLDAASVVREAEFFLSLDSEESKRDGKLEARVNLAAAVELESIEREFPESIRDEVSSSFDEVKGSVSAVRTRYFRDLPIAGPASVPLESVDAGALLAAGLNRDVRGFFGKDERAARWLRRTLFVKKWMPESPLPDYDEVLLQQLVGELCAGKKRLSEISSDETLGVLESRLAYKEKKLVDTEAPDMIEVPSGSRIRVEYDERGGAMLSVRLQEIFGWLETPKLAGGRAPVTVELLSPNFRAVQITNDLKSFWARGYAEVRKELRARYPKHSWPDDPYTAKPEAKGRRRR